MPYTSMPAWPKFSDEEVSDLAYFVTTFSPDFSNKERVPQAVQLPSAPGATKESAEQGKKIFADTGCVKCHGTLGRGDGPSAPTLMDDWNHPIRAADLSQSWTFRGGSSREDIFRTLSTGLNGTPMPSFTDSLTPEQRWAITDFIVSLSGTNGPGYSNLVIAKHVDDPIDLSKGSASFASAAAARFRDHRADHRARARVPSADHQRDRAVDLRRRLHRGARPMARPERGEGRGERALAAGASGGRRGSRAGGVRRRRACAWRKSVRRCGGGAAAPAAQKAPANPFEEEASPAAKASEFSDAVAVQIPSQTPTGPRKPYFIFGDGQNSVDLWFFDLARPEPPAVHGQGQRRHHAQRQRRGDGRRELRPGRVVGDFQAAAARHVRRAVYPGRVPARSRSPSGTGSRASAGASEACPSGIRYTWSLKTFPRRLAR